MLQEVRVGVGCIVAAEIPLAHAKIVNVEDELTVGGCHLDCQESPQALDGLRKVAFWPMVGSKLYARHALHPTGCGGQQCIQMDGLLQASLNNGSDG
jgi:hypothetical protein